jgi:hypothetical protein
MPPLVSDSPDSKKYVGNASPTMHLGQFCTHSCVVALLIVIFPMTELRNRHDISHAA